LVVSSSAATQADPRVHDWGKKHPCLPLHACYRGPAVASLKAEGENVIRCDSCVVWKSLIICEDLIFSFMHRIWFLMHLGAWMQMHVHLHYHHEELSYVVALHFAISDERMPVWL
jgi:hypothetical protein